MRARAPGRLSAALAVGLLLCLSLPVFAHAQVVALSLAFGWPGGALMLADRRGDRVYKLGLGAVTDASSETGGAPQDSSGSDANRAGDRF